MRWPSMLLYIHTVTVTRRRHSHDTARPSARARSRARAETRVSASRRAVRRRAESQGRRSSGRPWRSHAPGCIAVKPRRDRRLGASFRVAPRGARQRRSKDEDDQAHLRRRRHARRAARGTHDEGEGSQGPGRPVRMHAQSPAPGEAARTEGSGAWRAAGERTFRSRPGTCTGDHSCIRLSGSPLLTIRANLPARCDEPILVSRRRS
jgi:hypothetical protein